MRLQGPGNMVLLLAVECMSLLLLSLTANGLTAWLPGDLKDERGNPNFHKTLKVTTVLIEPYVMKINSTIGDPGGTRQYEGFLVDLLDWIRWKYTLIPIADGQFGMKKREGSSYRWNGMIGELVGKEADIAAGPMFKTPKRVEAVSFSDPFLHVQASLIMRQPSKGGPQGIESLIDLYHHPGVSFGTLNQGIVKKSLRASNYTLHKSLLLRMSSFRPRVFTKTNAEGLERVRSDNNGFVYILPSTIADYIVGRKPCDLKVVHSNLMEETFSLAVQKDSYLLPYLNKALENLQAQGVLDQLYRKWWFDKADCDVVPSVKTLRNADHLETYDMHSGLLNSAGGVLKQNVSKLLFQILLYSIATILFCEVRVSL